MQLKFGLFVGLIFIIFVSGCSISKKNKLSFAHFQVPEFDVRREILSNGLKILFIEDHSVPIVNYSTWVNVGSAWEKKGSTGIAHLFEHLMFKGTKKYSGKEFFKKLESKGAQINAFTQRDNTVYYEVIASQYLESVIEMEADRLEHLQLTQEELDSERQVVKEERRLRIESNYSAQQLELLEKEAFPDHPYGNPVIGYQDDLDRLSLNECKDFFGKYYQPNNILIVVSGDFDRAKTLEWMKKYYGGIKGKKIEPLILSAEKKITHEKRLVIDRPVEGKTILMGYHVPNMFSEDAKKISMLSWVLFSLNNSLISKTLIRDKHLALGVAGDVRFERYPGLFLISIDLKPGTDEVLIEKEYESLIDDFKLKGVAETELEKIKNKMLYALVNETKSPSGVANWFASGEFYWGDFHKVYSILEEYKSVIAADLQEVAKKYLRRENRIWVLMQPGDNQKKTLSGSK